MESETFEFSHALQLYFNMHIYVEHFCGCISHVYHLKTVQFIISVPLPLYLLFEPFIYIFSLIITVIKLAFYRLKYTLQLIMYIQIFLQSSTQ